MTEKTPPPLDAGELEELEKMALEAAIHKARTLTVVDHLLRAAEHHLRNYEQSWNTFAHDPELIGMRETLEKLGRKMPTGGAHYTDQLSEALGGFSVEEREYANPNDDFRLRIRHAGIDWDEYGDDDSPDIPFVDPLVLYKQLKGG